MLHATRRFRFALIALALMASYFVASTASAKINWQNSPQSTLASARESGKPILVFVTTDWCHYCTKMKKETWSDPAVSSTVSENFVTLVLDGDRDQQIVQRLGLRGFPATLLYTPDGHFITQRGGFMPPAKTLQWLASARR